MSLQFQSVEPPIVTVANLDERKASLRHYFGAAGFERWRATYGDGPVSFIRGRVRTGHAAVVAQALSWIGEKAMGQTLAILDAGCGTGLAALALARSGHSVFGCDLAPEMVGFAQIEAQAQPSEVSQRLQFAVSDLESVGEKVQGQKFDLVLCLDVLIYYPEEELARIFQKLVALQKPGGDGRIVFTYAPASLLLRLMHRLGRVFPRKQRAPGFKIIGQQAVSRALEGAGLRLNRQQAFNTGFYHVVLAEATPINER